MRAKMAVLVAVATIWTMSTFAVEQGDVAPTWQAISFQGESVSFPALSEGKPTILIFWATWCDYCKAFMPYLNRIQDDYGADRVSIVAVNAKEGDGDPDAYVKELNFPLTAIRDGDDIAAQYGVKFIPGLFVVGGNGTVFYRRAWTELPPGHTVAQFWSDQLRAALDKAL